MRRLVLPLEGALLLGLGVSAGADPLRTEQPEPSRWTADAEPDAPVERMSPMESVTDTASVANLAAAYGVLETSIFMPYVPGRAEQIKAVQPPARMLLSNQGFDTGRINEAHDGCALVIPNVYQGDVTGTEAGDLLHARELGADGAQVNRPDLAVATLGRPVATVLEGAPRQVCLLDSEHSQGLPGKTLSLGDSTPVTTGVGGCVALAGPAGRVRFDGDASSTSSSTVVSGGSS